jgi:hypothetical protein
MLFCGDDTQDKLLFNSLRNRWHPDKHQNATDIKQIEDAFKCVGELYQVRKQQLDAGTWRGAGMIELEMAERQKLRLRYQRRRHI